MNWYGTVSVVDGTNEMLQYSNGTVLKLYFIALLILLPYIHFVVNSHTCL